MPQIYLLHEDPIENFVPIDVKLVIYMFVVNQLHWVSMVRSVWMYKPWQILVFGSKIDKFPFLFLSNMINFYDISKKKYSKQKKEND